MHDRPVRWPTLTRQAYDTVHTLPQLHERRERVFLVFAGLFLGSLLGLPLVVFGLNGFLEFMEPPADPTPEGQAFLDALEASGFVMPIVKGLEVLCGALLVLGLFVPLALTLLAPIVVNIVGYHVTLDPAGMPIAIGVAVLGLFLAWSYRLNFAGVLSPRRQREIN